MIRYSTAFATVLLASTSVAAALELAPGNGHSIRLGQVTGAVYYTVEPDGYRVVATLASGADAQPVRFVSTLGPGQHMMISLPQAVGQPSLDFKIMRYGTTVLVREPAAIPMVDPMEQASIQDALDR
ncbi:hypothetical protein EJ066_15050 [Mesorhizobium sp. M9A.F.Ca.ET.002.03.1.2]|uniref:hypothetical protein n=1 Tax=Mesorhizobium sp. M9A.F.Ca.ET.002.03.1.2 TaxID=2493668 RepID=UPI000F7548BD|nr:hypothetical protein [Mesorhizobium sp. M9A.F.Ca.ET.002.03.1.2]AZN98375.1 hypothetical protein EJ066_15050 [Mesorhizobium sp. M9A.F.Ca.ET.002.03.1.2]